MNEIGLIIRHTLNLSLFNIYFYFELVIMERVALRNYNYKVCLYRSKVMQRKDIKRLIWKIGKIWKDWYEKDIHGIRKLSAVDVKY